MAQHKLSTDKILPDKYCAGYLAIFVDEKDTQLNFLNIVPVYANLRMVSSVHTGHLDTVNTNTENTNVAKFSLSKRSRRSDKRFVLSMYFALLNSGRCDERERPVL